MEATEYVQRLIADHLQTKRSPKNAMEDARQIVETIRSNGIKLVFDGSPDRRITKTIFDQSAASRADADRGEERE